MIIPKDWGFEDVAYNGEYCFKRMFVQEGHRSSVHKHEVKDEVLMVSPGGLFFFETGTAPDVLKGQWMEENDRIRITPGLWHRFTAIRDSMLYEASTHHEDTDSIRYVKGGKIDAQEMRTLYSTYYKDKLQSNILTVQQSGMIAESIRREGKTIGLCNGCFDLLHPGHLSFLALARARCEVLFVACNSDRAIKEMKGPTRPFINESGRMAALSATRFVDYVIFIDNKTCVEAVNSLRPDVYITTKEHAPNNIPIGPEAEAATKLGATLQVVDMIDGYNTTAISSKFKK